MRTLNSLLVLMMSLSSFAQSHLQIGEPINFTAQAISMSSNGEIVALGRALSNAVYVYALDSLNNWNQLGSGISGESSGDQSGKSVSISNDGTVVAIGAPYNDGGGLSSGHVRVYKYLNGSWSQRGSDIDGSTTNHVSGHSVSLSGNGDRVAIGAPLSSANIYFGGAVKVFDYSNGSWSQAGSSIFGDNSYDCLGSSVSLSDDGNTLATGGVGQTVYWSGSTSSTRSGVVKTYKYSPVSGGSWIQQVDSNIFANAGADFFGDAISLSGSGNVLAVGAPFTSTGYVKTYKYDSTGQTSGFWTLDSTIYGGAAANDQFGKGISLSDDGGVLAIGAPLNNNNGVINNGYVRIYKYINSGWQVLGDSIIDPTINGIACGNCLNSGQAVSLSSGGQALANGFSNSSAVFAIFPIPISLTLSSSVICSGSGDTIQASVPYDSAVSYLWNTGDTSSLIDIYQAGNYSVKYKPMGLGYWMDSINFIISQVPNVNGPQLYGNVNVVPGSSEIYLTSQDLNNSYVWQINGGAILSGQGTNSITVIWGSGGSGDVIVVESNSFCSNSDTLNVNISGVGIEEVNGLSSIFLKPNPNNGYFSIEVDQQQMGSTYRIVDFLGRTIETGTITRPSQDFDLSDKHKGVYRVQVSNERASKTLNVVIQ